MIKRSDKLAFMKISSGTGAVYSRLTGFTELSVSKNPREYSRKYVDEDSERNAVVGYSPSMSYKLDLDTSDSVHQAFAEIADEELTGEDAVRTFAVVDLTSANASGVCNAWIRDFTIVPQSEGDDSDTYTCSGSIKATGAMTVGTATSSDGWKTMTFTAS